MRAGIIASAVANHGSRVIQEPYRPRDFMPYVNRDDDAKPVLHKDPEQQSALILRGVFNREAA
ncbi:hypothetical protein PPMP20_19000 [Paraburkholderia phymatum]|uniref:Uncharacterized protein n=1 Tax=Paraburkholderia phymatum (strain DSM 17167 / CIP 108236 / LMG 21445 / STM815) TaxID=391038 RepID=B2JUI2_PARP8|nr:hypothetical protein [Paraburkholderia phymatum]ACC76153.1 hypothetical protein Bphy_7152 [Paraburkholderia phymatum STM815]